MNVSAVIIKLQVCVCFLSGFVNWKEDDTRGWVKVDKDVTELNEETLPINWSS